MGVCVVNRVLDGGDLLGVFVRNLNAKLVFQSHNQFYGVKRVSAQIGHKSLFIGNLTFFHAELFGNDLPSEGCKLIRDFTALESFP
jgi:hypothetical protein